MLCIPKFPVLLYRETQPLALSRHRPIFDVAFSPAPASCRGLACNRKSTTVNRPTAPPPLLPATAIFPQTTKPPTTATPPLLDPHIDSLHSKQPIMSSDRNSPPPPSAATNRRRSSITVKRSKSSLAVPTALVEVRIPLQPTQALSPLRPPKLSGAVSLLPPSACRALQTRPHPSAPSAPARKASRVPTLVRLTKVLSRMTRLRPPQVSPTRRLQGV